ncbi:MAG: (deoxy)nucleoside triphosphate pyrophosphohydrolase [bacterium]|nr:(deoxy)nucleoside triphosphate pyrophosphohydrolase [bacterium]
MRPIVCAAAIIRRGRALLIARRKPDSRLEPLKWEFPGGKIEYTEDPRVCLVREIREEMNVRISVDAVYDIVSHTYRKGGRIFHVLLLCYLCTYRGGRPRPLDCHETRWVRIGDLGAYDFAAADLPIVRRLSAPRRRGR